MSDVSDGYPAASVAVLLCPHCSTPLPETPVAGPMRCGACRLIVGPGRGVPANEGDPLGATVIASGALANFARSAGADPVDPQVAISAFRRVAAQVGVRVEELRLIHHRQALAAGASGPTLAEVMATFRTRRTALDAATRERI